MIPLELCLNKYKTGKVDHKSNVQKMHITNSDKPVNFSSLMENHFAEVDKMVSLKTQHVQNLHMLSRTILPR